MVTNVFVLEVSQGSYLEKFIAELNERSSFEVRLFPALSSALRCREEAFAVMVSGGFPLVKEVAEKLKGFTGKRILIPFEDCAVPQEGKLLRMVKAEVSLGVGEYGKDYLPGLYHDIGTSAKSLLSYGGYLWVYAKDEKLVAMMISPEHPNQEIWQSEIAAAFRTAGLSPQVKDVLLISV